VRRLVAAALVAGSLACGPTLAERESVLAEYRRALDRVPSERDVPRPKGDPDLLVGLTRERIRQVLGEPHDCSKLSAPCESRDDWFYSFYALDEGTDGGGLELLLRFDGSGKCTAARWDYSE
jgi:hypothetical protein